MKEINRNGTKSQSDTSTKSTSSSIQKKGGPTYGSLAKDSLVQRSINDQANDKSLQRKGASESSSKIPSSVQAKMENSFGTDFSNVIIHQGESATQMNALAYTQGNDIHFAPGQYNPESQSGQELLGHELTHVVQQRSGRVQPTTQLKGVGLNDDNGLEKEEDVLGKNVTANSNTTNPVEKKSDVPTIILPEVSTNLNFSVGAPSAKYKEELINFSGDVRLVQNRLKEIGLLSDKDYTSEFPKSETNTNPDIIKDINQSRVTQASNINTEIELTETEKLMLSVYQKIGKGPQVLTSSIPNTIESIKIFQREVKLGKVIDGRIDVGATSNLLLSISKAEVIKCRENYKLKKKQEDEQNKKELERIQKEEASRKWEEERIKGLTEAPTDDESIEKIIDKYDDESELACLLIDYAEYNPTLVIKVLDASDYSDQDDIVMEMMKIIDDNLLTKFSSDLLSKMKESLDEGWTDNAEKKEINRIENVTSNKTILETNNNSGFEKVFPLILENEGGWKDEPEKDKGDPTNKGISWPIWQQYAKEDLDIEPSRENLRNLTNEQAKVIYLKRYWSPNGFASIKDQELAFLIYDWTITSGGAIEQVQILLNDEFDQKLDVDGGIGPMTINAINSVESDILFNRIKEIRIEYYKKGADAGWFSVDYLKGLIIRVNKFKDR